MEFDQDDQKLSFKYDRILSNLYKFFQRNQDYQAKTVMAFSIGITEKITKI